MPMPDRASAPRITRSVLPGTDLAPEPIIDTTMNERADHRVRALADPRGDVAGDGPGDRERQGPGDRQEAGLRLAVAELAPAAAAA